MTQDSEQERRRLAYRLAGVAVARHAQGNAPKALDLSRPILDDPGRAWPVDLGSGARHRLELEILALWAGLNSESRACREGREPEGGWGEALTPLAELGRRVTRSEGENAAYLEWLRCRAAGLLDLEGVWPAVEALAAALLEQGSLGPDQAAAVIGGVQRAHRRRSGFASIFRNVR